MYNFQQEKIQLPTLSPVKLKYELTITPGIHFQKDYSSFFQINFLADFGIQSNIQITPAIIVERIDCFRRSLLNLVKTHHQVKYKSSSNLFQ